MKIELVEEKNPFDGSCWYSIFLDGVYIKGNSKKEESEDLYNRIKSDPSILETKKKVLLSDEITVNS